MSIRRTSIDRITEAQKSNILTIGRGKPLNSLGAEGDLTFRRTSDGLKLYVKAASKWHGVKVGESFDSLEKAIKEIKSKVNTIKQFRLPSTYSVNGNFTLDASGDISLDADGGEVYIKDNGATFGEFTTSGSRSSLKLYENAGASADDYFQMLVASYGATTLSTTDAAGQSADMLILPDGHLKMQAADNETVTIDANNTTTTSGSNKGFEIDYDHTGITASGQLIYNSAAKITLNSASPTHVGGLGNRGVDIEVTGGTSGSQTGNGIYAVVTGHDTNRGIYLKVDDGGEDIKLVSSANTLDYCTISTTANGATTIATVDADAALGFLTLDADGIINIDANANLGIAFKKDGTEFARLNGDSNTSRFTIFENIGASTDDYFRIDVEAAGVTTISTLDASQDAGAAHLTLDIDGDITLDAGSAAGRIYFKKAGSDFARITGKNDLSSFVLYEAGGASTSDYFQIQTDTAGQTLIRTVDDAGAAGHLNIEADGHVEFDGCGVGFDLVTPTYNSSATTVDFRTGNKQFVTFGSGNIITLDLIFPTTSGNFVVLLKQDGTGSRTITNYRATIFGGSPSTVKFAGGSNPTLTTDANHVDIISLFWDADNEICYGVATLDFQF